MKEESPARLIRTLDAFPRIAGATAIVIGTTVIVGWIFDVPVLKSLHPDVVSMKANTAIGFILAGISILLLSVPHERKQTLLSGFFAWMVFLVGFINVLQYVFVWDAGIDQVLFTEPEGTVGTYSPGRMALNTAISFCFIGLTVVTLNGRSRWSRAIAQIAPFTVALFGLLVLLSYAYGPSEFIGLSVYTQMALQTAVAFLLLGVGLLCLQPHAGIMAIVREDAAAGYMARRLMPAALVIPAVLAWLVVRGEMSGMFGNQFGEAIVTTAYIGIFILLIWTTGRSLVRLDVDRKRAGENLRETNEYLENLFKYANAPIIVWDPELVITRFNHAFEHLSGYAADEVRGKKIDILFPAESLDSSLALISRAVSGERWETVEIEIQRKDGDRRIVLWNSANILDREGTTVVATIAQGHDITDRKRMNDAIESQFALLSALINSPEDIIIFSLDREYRYTTFNEKHHEEMKRVWNADIKIGMNLLDCMQMPELRELAKQSIDRALKGESFSEIQHQPNADIYYEFNWNPILQHEVIVGVTVFIRNITDRMRTEEALRETNEYLENLLNHANVPIIVWDPALVTTRFNHAFEFLSGYTADEVRGKRIDVLFPKEFLESSLALIRRAVGGERWEIVEIDIQRKDGGLRTVLWNSANILDKAGTTIVATIAQGQDISERKRVETEVRSLLEASEHSREALLSLLEDQKQSEERVRHLNEQLRSLSNAVQELASARDLAAVTDVVRRWARSLVGADGITFVLREDNQCHYVEEDAIGPLWKGMKFPIGSCISGWAMLHGEAAVIENIYTDPRIPVEAYRPTFVKSLAMAPIRRKDSIGAIGAYWGKQRQPTKDEVAILQTLADATARAIENVRLYDDLERRVAERTAQLDSSNRELEAFSYSVAHDLRAPLRSIDGFSQALLEDYGIKLDAQGVEFLNRVRDGAQNMGLLIDDLLKLSRITRDAMDIKTVDLSAIVQAVGDGHYEKNKDRIVTLIVAPEVEVRGDPRLLRIALENLLGNAWKFTEKHDKARIEFGVTPGETGPVYFIRDDGAGFDQSYVDRLFSPFQRLHNHAEFPGTGIGLAIVRRIVQRHGGRVWAEGSIERGATVSFTLSPTIEGASS